MARQDYSTSKYQDAVTEWAYLISLDGMCPTAGDLSEGRDWSALVTLRYDADVPAEVMADATDGIAGLFDGAAVIIREDSQGFVWTDYGPTHPTADPRAWRELMTAWSAIGRADAGEED